MAYIIVWEYQVRPEQQAEFEDVYSSHGAWVELFKQSSGYLGTELLQDAINNRRYLTIDRWASKAEYEAFLLEWEIDYHALDVRCEGLTETESQLGIWLSS